MWKLEIEAKLLAIAAIQERQALSLVSLTESMKRYVDSSNARMEAIEQNLDALIRAITAEHSNGKGKR